MSDKKKYDTTVARIAGNIAAGLVNHPDGTIDPNALAEHAVKCARAIIAEVDRTEPKPEPFPFEETVK